MQINSAHFLNYADALRWVVRETNGKSRMGLDRINALTQQLGVPRGGSAQFFHVAGTNGKGSTTATIQAILTASGKKCGATFSPYVFDFRERVQVDGKLIPQEKFAEGSSVIKSLFPVMVEEGYGEPTMFETITALGFWFWEQEKCDTVALEVGLGGRLDATNIVDPAVSVIVSIGFDHTEILGGTLMEIAEEKAGIIKPGRPVVLGQLHRHASEVIRLIARQNESPIYEFGKEWFVSADKDESEFELTFDGQVLRLPKPLRLKGPIQTHNAALAAVACLVGDPELRHRLDCAEVVGKGIKTAFQPGRFQIFQAHGRTWILDGAHNEQASAELIRTFRSQFPGIKAELVHGMFDKRDPMDTVPQFATICNRAQFVTIGWQGARKAEELHELCGKYFAESRAATSAEDVVANAQGDVVLVTGSYYLLAEIAKATGLNVGESQP